MILLRLVRKHKQSFLYAVCLAAMLYLLRWLELRFIIFSHSFEIYAGCVAVVFTALGIWLAQKFTKPRIQTLVVEKEIFVHRNENFVLNSTAIEELELSKRELEILNLMAKGMSNEEIASTIFVSVSTVKSHNQNLFAKLDVKRRMQAIEKAKRLQIIP